MTNRTIWLAIMGLVLGGVLLASPAPVRAGDEKCVAACDEAADHCHMQAGKDKERHSSCDKDYDSCLAKCP